MSDLNSVNRYISLSLSNSSAAQAKTSISVQFPVKEIRVRQIVYQDDQNFKDLTSFGILVSDLVQNNVLGIVNMSSSINATNNSGTGHQGPQISNVRYAYRTPISVNGTYFFELRTVTGNPINFAGSGTYHIGLILEFIEYRTPMINADV